MGKRYSIYYLVPHCRTAGRDEGIETQMTPSARETQSRPLLVCERKYANI